MEEVLGEYQEGFRKGRGTIDQIFMLKQIIVGNYEYRIPTYLLFVDFKKAYDTVNRTQLINVLRELDIPEKLVNLITITLKNTISRVKVKGKTSDSFNVKQGSDKVINWKFGKGRYLGESLEGNKQKEDGHLERMTQEREVKMVAWKIPEGKRKRGRPRKKWKEAIEEDLAENKYRPGGRTQKTEGNEDASL
ncbi:uncharacterized protein LOC135123842 [Zophobas morio]|uniref:uncharacterized protein LOC135123842 n=1 Tax=Zophobas morio TaxID=2755281 RepID=UPI00308313C6